MTYIVERNNRFYVVAYDGLDPLTGRERRRWIPIGHDRSDAEAVAARLDNERIAGPPPVRGTVTVGDVLGWLVDAAQATPRPRDHGVPVRVVHRPIHQPRDR